MIKLNHRINVKNVQMDKKDIIISIDDILKADDETVWNTLVGQVLKGNVIPVIGNDMVQINGISSEQYILNVIKQAYKIEDDISSFTALMNHPKCHKPESLYGLVSNITLKYSDVFKASETLKNFLFIKYFPFIITTTIDPVIENTMREIYGEKLRILSFDNNPSSNDDIRNSYDVTDPTLYYMFGRANGGKGNFVLSDTDLLRFSRSWLLPKDSSNFAKPANLSNALSNKYLLVLGNNFQDWLFRFFWFAMKDEKLNNKSDIPNGMDASEHSDDKLIEFLTFSNITSQIVGLPDFVAKLKKFIEESEVKNGKELKNFDRPIMNADVFVSYSRADSKVVDQLYKALKERGLKVWYDKTNLGLADDFKSEIRRAIRTCSLFVPILSHNIAKQAADEHVYRLEWSWAVEHKKMISSAIPYIVPLAENGFDVYDKLADIPEDIQCHNAFFFDDVAQDRDLSVFAKKISELLKSK
ncbi:toll/interleukin-1 receptor domain-containing protein [Phocaeicola plebeius]|jgi:RHS repeat protein|uniref:toll/interleukin-1 receptor domain-containing protein n=1 Tax=Phocaeicola plebeius TaxID=310297 RepID=UPI0026F30638|nr:toll/interleukin-1 receptor domain-containing protein [Phocaeicola plebeius]